MKDTIRQWFYWKMQNKRAYLILVSSTFATALIIGFVFGFEVAGLIKIKDCILVK